MKKTAIVGCGNIAGFLDSPGKKYTLTHAHAYQKHTQTNLIAVCEPSAEQREKFLLRWGNEIRRYDSIQKMLQNEKIDILSICSPTTFHFEAMLEALKDKNIKTIICEKPFVQTQKEQEILSSLIQKSDKKIIINFMRRYDPSINELKTIIDEKKLGDIITFSAKFTKGLYHNGSHMLELIENLCGEITQITANEIAHVEDDIIGTFYIKTENKNGVLQNFSGNGFALFELEIILTHGRIKINDSGHKIEIEKPYESKYYQNYFNLKTDKILPDTMQNNLYNTVEFALKSNNTKEIFIQHLNISKKLLDIKKRLQDEKKRQWSIDE